MVLGRTNHAEVRVKKGAGDRSQESEVRSKPLRTLRRASKTTDYANYHNRQSHKNSGDDYSDEEFG